MTDTEIIKALETHLSDEGKCSECAYLENIGSCVGIMHKDLYDLINRQKAEIERLQAHNSSMQSTLAKMSMGVEQAKSEAIKEFAKRLKSDMSYSYLLGRKFCTDITIDNLVKEMVGETE